MSLPKDILPQVTAAELDAFSTIGGEERLIAFVNRFREQERERIIKLLEDNMYYSELDLVLFWNDENGGYQVTLEDLIALIKGERE